MQVHITLEEDVLRRVVQALRNRNLHDKAVFTEVNGGPLFVNAKHTYFIEGKFFCVEVAEATYMYPCSDIARIKITE